MGGILLVGGIIKELFCETMEKSKNIILEKLDDNVRFMQEGRCFLKYEAIKYMEFFFENRERIQNVYLMLDDFESRANFRWIIKNRMAYALVGEFCYSMFPFSEISTFSINKIDKDFEKKEIDDNLFLCNGLTINSKESVIDGTWKNEEYSIKGVCEPLEGDIVISAGGYLGETALWFAQKVTDNGHVYTFEPTKNSYDILTNNIVNNRMENVISAFNIGLMDSNGEFGLVENRNSSNNEICKNTDVLNRIDVTTIDEFVSGNSLKKVDYIKMDVEGAESSCLKGAVSTIKKFKPKIAACIYHKPTDLVEVAEIIKGIVPEYKLKITHKNPYLLETVLFAHI